MEFLGRRQIRGHWRRVDGREEQKLNMVDVNESRRQEEMEAMKLMSTSGRASAGNLQQPL